MHKKDFLVKQFEQFGKVLAQILGYKQKKDWENFQKELNAATLQFTPFNPELVESMSLQEVETEALSDRLSPDQVKILATILYEKMMFYAETRDQSKYENLREKCILLYQIYADNLMENEFDLDVHYKLQSLNKLK